MKPFIVLLATIFPAIIFAQPNYHAGYIVKNTGDTVKGFINYRDWAYSPESIEFKAGKNDTAVLKLTADNIKAFGLEGFDAYKSFVGDVSLNKNIFPNISSAFDSSHATKALFLKPIKKGVIVDFYYNNEINKDRFFVTEKNSPPFELKYYEYFNSATTEAFQNVFKMQLQLLAVKLNTKSKRLARDLDRARYNLADIGEIVDDLNEIDDISRKKADSIQSANTPAFYRFFAGVAVNHTIIDDVSSPSVKPKFNVGIDFFYNPNVQQLILRVELGYTWLNDNIVGEEYNAVGEPQAFNVPYSQYTFSVNPQVIFNAYNTDRFKFYIDGGASFNFSGYSGVSGFSAFYVALPVQAGFVFNRKWELFAQHTFKSKYLGLAYSDTLQADSFGIKRLF
jgi:hypothetical protein